MESGSSSKMDIIKGEVQIMQSAFAKEFEDLRKKNSEFKHTPPDVRLKLGPHHTEGGTLHSHVQVVVRITTTFNYPNEAAEIIIESSEGIMDEDKSQLAVELKNLSTELARDGKVVMLEVTNYIQNFLTDHARPYTENIYAEMIAGWKAKAEALQQKERENLKMEQKQDEEKRREIKEEVDRIQEALKAEAKMRQERMKTGCVDNHNDKSTSPLRRWHSRTASECSGEATLNDTCNINPVVFTTTGKKELCFIAQECLGERSDQGFVIFGQEKESQEKLVMYSWIIQTKKIGKNHLTIGLDLLLDELVSKFNSIEKEMSSLLRLSHENLVPFKAIKVSRPHNDYIGVHFLQEFVQGLTLKYYIDLKLPQNESFVHHVASGLLKALDYLHLNNVVHRNLRDSCVFLDNQSKLIRLADFGVERRCVEVVAEFDRREATSSYPISPGRGGKKCDVFRFGLVLLSLCLGERVSQVAPSLPQGISKSFKDFLSHCLELTEQDRWTFHQLIQHSFIASTTENQEPVDQDIHVNGCCDAALFNHKTNVKDCSLTAPLQLPPDVRSYSRYSIEYHCLESLGKGGFGHVYKVRNLVDDRVYALKRIPLHHQTEATRRKMTREVKLLSSLNHENVVRYYTSWIESFTQEQLEEECKGEFKTLSSAQEELTSFSEDDANIVKSESEDEENEDWLMANLRNDDNEESEDIVFVDSATEERETEEERSSQSEVKKKTKEEKSSKKVVNQPTKRLQYLFIQMQYCEKNTLRQAIDKCLYAEKDRVWRLFREIINGLDYIHSQGLIHRDLKPGNVFMDSSDHIKIGDFGLATVAFKEVGTTATDSNQGDHITTDAKESSAFTGRVGTTLYIAPELTKVVGKISYSNKLDIYSLGIIFFEMVYPLSTGMERVKLLSSLRLPQPQFPDDFKTQTSMKKQKLISWLLNHNPLERPSTGELLKSSLLPPPTAEEQKFMSTLESKIQNTRSKDFQDILNLLFRPYARPELEATFEICQHKYSPSQLLVYDYVKSQIIGIFRSHGAIFIPTSFYIPRGSFYHEKENLVSLMSKGGELIAAQFELRYPFARFVARSDLKHIKRYSIDRVQRAHKISGIHPTEIYECAFDIIGAKRDLAESCARVILVAQEVLHKMSSWHPSQIIVKICHSELVKVILIHCGVEEAHHAKVISLLHEFRSRPVQLEQFCEYMKSLKINKNIIDNLKAFVQLEASVDDVCSVLQSKILSSGPRRKLLHTCFTDAVAEIREVAEVASIMGVKFEFVMRPLLVVEKSLYQGVAFQLVSQALSKKASANVLAQGGSYDHIINHLRSQSLTATKRTESFLSAVGISLPFDRVAASFDSSKLLLPHLTEARSKASQGHLTSEVLLTEIFICAIEFKQLEERVNLITKLKADNIIADHGFVLSLAEAEGLYEEFWFVNHFVFYGSSDKIICRSREIIGQDQTSRFNDKKINRSDLYEHLFKLVKAPKGYDIQTSAASSVKERKESFMKSATTTKPEEFAPRIEYVTRKQKIKDIDKIESRILEEMMPCLGSRWSNITAADSIDVLALDLDKKALLTLGQLDVDSTVRSFNESVVDLKSRFPDMKDYIESICKSLLKRVFYSKKIDRPTVILCYSIPSGCLKRIL